MGYATLDSFLEGMKKLRPPGGYRSHEAAHFYQQAFNDGLDCSLCRPGGGIQLKHDLRLLMAHGKAALKEQSELQACCTGEVLAEAGRLQQACAAAEEACSRLVDVASHVSSSMRKTPIEPQPGATTGASGTPGERSLAEHG